MAWFVYIIEAEDGSLYTGITTDVERRFREHTAGPRGAKYFAGRRPSSVVYTECVATRSDAGRREAEIKAMNRLQKLRLIG